MKTQEYQFQEFEERIRFARECKDSNLWQESIRLDLIALKNTITGLESTRYPGNESLLAYQKEIQELLKEVPHEKSSADVRAKV